MPSWSIFRRLREPSWWRAVMATLPVLAITGYLYFESRNSERLLIEAETARQADNVFLQFQNFVGSQTGTLRSVGSFVLSTPENLVDASFAPFVDRLLMQRTDFQSICWKQQTAQVRQFARLGLGSGRAVLPGGDLVESAEQKASETRQAAATPSFQTSADEEAFVIVVPLFNGEQPLGWIEGTVRLSQAMRNLFGQDVLDFWNLEIKDRTGRTAYHVLGAQMDKPTAPNVVVERHVPVADRAWVFRLWPTHLLVSTLHTGGPARIMGIGFVAAALLALANYLLSQHQARLQASFHESRRLAADVEGTRQHLSDLVNGIDAAIWESDTGVDRFTFINDYARKLLKVSPTDWVSEPAFWSEHVHPDDQKKVNENTRSAQVPGATYPVEYRMIDAHGGTMWVREIVTVIDSAGKAAGKRGVVVDITERVQAEEALRQSQKLESLGVLAGGIAHDFNNLLTTILGNTELLKPFLDHQVNPASVALDKIERTTRRLAELTRQMLAYSGRGRFSVQPVDLNEIVRELIDFLTVSIPKTIKVTPLLKPRLPLTEADAAQIRQVVLNLLTNASEAIGDAPDGVVVARTDVVDIDEAETSTAYAEQNLEPGRYVRLQVSDNGCGMTEETLSKIFDPFFTTKFTGRGLGLAALRGIVRGHQGGIHIQTASGEGTVFTVVLPAVSGRKVLPVVSRPPQATGSNLNDTGVLIVDDEESLRALMVSALEEAGCTVYEASDGEEGLERFEEHRENIDVIVLDLTMPRLGGEEVFRRIRDRHPHTKVIMCSGYTEEDIVRRFDGDGLSAFIEKPFKPSELVATVGNVLADGKNGFDGEHPSNGHCNDGRKNTARGV